jgi:hypothetical protein
MENRMEAHEKSENRVEIRSSNPIGESIFKGMKS